MITINWVAFTPWASLIGGLVIGLAATAFILLHGRVMGVSGILSGLVVPLKGDIGWRIAFLSGLIAAPVLAHIAGLMPPIEISAGIIELAIAGLFVGFGTALGSGCTSGHGVCGISRLSPRSILATCVFVGFGMITVYLRNHAGWGG